MGKALLSEFQILTNDNWAAMMYNLMDNEISWVTAIYFCFLVIFGSFFLVNIVLAVILDSFTKVQQEELKLQLASDDKKMHEVIERMEKDIIEQQKLKDEEEEKKRTETNEEDKSIDEEINYTTPDKHNTTTQNLMNRMNESLMSQNEEFKFDEPSD